MPQSGLSAAVSAGALTLAESLIATGWSIDAIAEHLIDRYGGIDPAQAEQIALWADQALNAGKALQEGYGEQTVDQSGAPCLPGLSGSDYTVGYKFTWTDPETKQQRSWYDTLTVPSGTTVQELFDGSVDLFAETVGVQYLGGNILAVSGFDFTIESVTCPA
jgi:hypothetical protein